ncbi:MarR family winged helix-turn-helix transcriptional regulator [Candidatus Omnitrophota bacterium]
MSKNDIKPFAQEVAQLLPAIHRAVVKTQGDFFGLGKLTIPQFIFLELLYQYNPLKMKDVARELKVSLPAVTGLVSRLISLGMVERKYDKQDRRVIHIVLTAKGKKMVEQARTMRIKAFDDIFSRLTEEERGQYLRILRKLYTILYSKEL